MSEKTPEQKTMEALEKIVRILNDEMRSDEQRRACIKLLARVFVVDLEMAK